MERKDIIMPGAVVVAAVILATGFFMARSQPDSLSVTGSAKKAVVADTAKLTLHWSRSVGLGNLKSGYEQMKTDETAVRGFIRSRGFPDADVTVSAVSLEEPNRYNRDAVQEYVLRQYLTVSTSDIEMVASLAKELQPLVDQGVVLAPQQPEYYYSKLADLRIELLGEAVKDARARAAVIATNGGQRLGSLMSATMGVVQVLTPNSTDVSDYGTYDTSSQQKEVMVTVRASFRVR